MGLGPNLSIADSYNPTAVPPNPNPANFKIKRVFKYGNWTAVEVNYPDCTNYEGNKVIVAEISPQLLAKLTKIDPHFTDEDDRYFKPFARFEPTERGWVMACMLASEMDKVYGN